MTQKTVQQEGTKVRALDKKSLPAKFSSAVWTAWFVLMLVGLAIEIGGDTKPNQADQQPRQVGDAYTTPPNPGSGNGFTPRVITLGEVTRSHLSGTEVTMRLGDTLKLDTPPLRRGEAQFQYCTRVVAPRSLQHLMLEVMSGNGTANPVLGFRDTDGMVLNQTVTVRFEWWLADEIRRRGGTCPYNGRR